MDKFLFGKTAIEALPTPEKGNRAIYGDTRTPYLCLRVMPTTRTFFYQRTIKGRKVVITLDRFPAITADMAREAASLITARYLMGEDVKKEITTVKSEMTMLELHKDYRINRPKGKGKISPQNDKNFDRHFKVWSSKPLSEITQSVARKMILKLRENAPIHANRVQQLGSGMFNYAIKELEWKGTNPFKFAKYSEVGRARKTKRLHKSDMPAFFTALDSLHPTFRDLFKATLFTSRRIGECMKMRWVDVDLADGIWTIPEEIDGVQVQKTGMDQDCFLPTVMVNILSERKRDSKSQWVFPALRSDSKTGHVADIAKSWAKVRSFGFHHLVANDLRGSMGSILQEVGLPVAGAAQQMGHADAQTTLKNYTSISPEEQREGLENAAELIRLACYER